MKSFFVSTTLRLIAFVAAIQVICWLFAIDDAAYELLASYRMLTLLLVAAYYCVTYITYDAAMSTQKRKYSDRLKGASIRMPKGKRRD